MKQSFSALVHPKEPNSRTKISMIFEKKRAKHLPVSEKAVPLHSKTKTGYHGRVARHRSAKPATAVRICLVPQSKEHLAMSCSFFLWLFPS